MKALYKMNIDHFQKEHAHTDTLAPHCGEYDLLYDKNYRNFQILFPLFRFPT